MLNGLDLFSGIGGNSLALAPWVNTIAYCEGDRHAQAVLLSRMREGLLPSRPIWDDVRTLRGDGLPPIDIIIGGFPCQDISVAGKGAGLVNGKRSGLFYEISRLAEEVEPTFLFLENVPAIRTRGLDAVIEELTRLGYDLRWTMLSAESVGAPHKRNRWFLLAAHAERVLLRLKQGRSSWPRREGPAFPKYDGTQELVADSVSKRLSRRDVRSGIEEEDGAQQGCKLSGAYAESGRSWTSEPDVGRVAHGVSLRVDRLKRLGNAVVPIQARQAFKELMGITTKE